LIFVILFGSGALVFLMQRADRPAPAAAAVKRHTVQRGPLEVRLRVTGNTTAREFANLTAPLLRGPESDNPMTLMRLAAAGTLVQKGKLVAAFDPQQMSDHLDDTRDGLNNQENAVKKRKAELALDQERLRQKLLAAKGALDKARLDLKTIEVRSAIRGETLRLAVEEAEALYRALQDEVNFQTDSQRAALRMQEITRDLEVLHVRRHEADLSRLEVYSPIDGLVVIEAQSRGSGDQMLFGEGDRMNPGTLFARVVNPKSMMVEATINQAEIERFQIGQEARIQLDAFPGQSFRARLHNIGALASRGGRREQFYVRTVPLTFQILESDPRILPGLSASADVLVDRVGDALLVPAEAVELENGQAFVQVETPQGLQKRAVTTGASDGLRLEIRSGVNEGDVLVVQ
jgi:multidrug efflux pump subunit AcrA (membrane-fusion protein)